MYKRNIEHILNDGYILDNNVCKMILEYSHPTFDGSQHKCMDLDMTDISSCIILEHSNVMIIGTENGRIHILDKCQSDSDEKKKWKCRYDLDGHNDVVHILKIHEERILVSVSADGRVCVWDLDNNNCFKKRLESSRVICGQHKFDTIQHLEILSENEFIVSTLFDCSLQVWNMKDDLFLDTKLLGHTSSIKCIYRLSRDSIISSSTDIILWKRSEGGRGWIKQVILDSPGDQYILGLSKYMFESDNILYTTMDGRVCHYDNKSEREIKCLIQNTCPIVSVSCTLDGKIVTSDCNGFVKVWNYDTEWKLVKCHKLFGGNICSFNIRLSDGKMFCLSSSGEIKIIF